MSRNPFDDEEFFAGYMKLRAKPDNYNNLFEQPNMRALLPDLDGRTVLDIGCGAGHNCADFVKRGALSVTGIDVSEKMLAVARTENAGELITYRRLDMSRISELDDTFDLVYSSLAIHYTADFSALVRDVYKLLNPRGTFLFSQEHPMTTAPVAGPSWVRDENGVKTAALVSDYLDEGERNINWLDTDYIKYHRPMSSIINILIDAGFTILRVVEPEPTDEVVAAAPRMYDEKHRPTALIVKAAKPFS